MGRSRLAAECRMATMCRGLYTRASRTYRRQCQSLPSAIRVSWSYADDEVPLWSVANPNCPTTAGLDDVKRTSTHRGQRHGISPVGTAIVMNAQTGGDGKEEEGEKSEEGRYRSQTELELPPPILLTQAPSSLRLEDRHLAVLLFSFAAAVDTRNVTEQEEDQDKRIRRGRRRRGGGRRDVKVDEVVRFTQGREEA